MRYKIQDAPNIKDKKKFLFLPRYCDGCLTAFWLEKVLFKWSTWWSPKGCPLCDSFLWSSKVSARRYFNIKKKQHENNKSTNGKL